MPFAIGSASVRELSEARDFTSASSRTAARPRLKMEGCRVRLVTIKRRVEHRLQAKAAAVRLQLETNLDRILQAWLLFAGLACAARIAVGPRDAPLGVEGLLPYILLILAPFASLVLALRWFADGDHQPQPRFRFARVGRWRQLTNAEAGIHPLYGCSGLMVSLALGMLINVPFRALEFLGAMPALSGDVPAWLSVLHAMMTIDAVVMTSLYAIAFVAAIRHVPLFPRLLVAIWTLDLTLQFATARIVDATPGLPQAVGTALDDLLDGNVQKVLISILLWAPYLLLSKRVNVTFRRRVASEN